jgi:uncharacterized protein (UPF0332 family)
MNFDWEDYLALAETLLEISKGTIDCKELDKQEAIFRSSISRAYYAAYHYALDYLLANTTFQLQNFDSHTAVINAYRTSVYRDRKAISQRLFQLKSYRIRADYNLSFDNSTQNYLINLEQVATDTNLEARRIINMVKNFTPRNNRNI